MTSFLGVRWDEWFALAMLIVVIGLSVFFLLQAFKNHMIDNPDCDKYEVFTTDPTAEPGEQPPMPTSCQPNYLESRPWTNPIKTGWVWVTIGIALIYLIMMVGFFLVSRGYPALRSALPV